MPKLGDDLKVHRNVKNLQKRVVRETILSLFAWADHSEDQDEELSQKGVAAYFTLIVLVDLCNEASKRVPSAQNARARSLGNGVYEENYDTYVASLKELGLLPNQGADKKPIEGAAVPTKEDAQMVLDCITISRSPTGRIESIAYKPAPNSNDHTAKSARVIKL